MKILTPDQRLKVFISSTIVELAEERAVVRKVVEDLHMIPVYFESGARPHPPRDLYRAYLEQSDIFIGIYYQSYGWVAPDMTISGIEDEWLLAKDKPKLIYIKNSEQRDDSLKKMLQSIQDSGTMSYQKFNNPSELNRILGNDIAILLTERFYQDKSISVESSSNFKTNLPILRNSTIGREKELKELKEKLLDDQTGLITLIGPGGTGKTRLSIELGNSLTPFFKDGVQFISLGSVIDYHEIPNVLAQALDINKSSNKSILESIALYLQDKKTLLILDNFEQIAEGGVHLAFLLNQCAQLKMLVTSRTPLYIRNEIIFPVQPLAYDQSEGGNSLEFSPSEELFMRRAQEVNPLLDWNAENKKHVKQICRMLEGLPLAIELTAARSRHLSPIQILQKMSSLLDAANMGTRDLPIRQQTMRNTIAWSYQLLTSDSKQLLNRLSIFQSPWSWEAMQSICWEGFGEKGDLELVIIQCIDAGLVIPIVDQNAIQTYRMLHIIREFASEKLKETDELPKLKVLHYQYFCIFCLNTTKVMNDGWAGYFDPAMIHIEVVYPDIVAAFQYALEDKNNPIIISIITVLNFYYVLTGRIGQLQEFLSKAQIHSKPEKIQELSQFVGADVLANLFFSTGFIRSTTGQFEEGIRDLQFVKSFSHEKGLHISYSQSIVFLGLTYLSIGQIKVAKEYFQEGILLSEKYGLNALRIICEADMSIILIEEGKMDEAVLKQKLLLLNFKTTSFPLVHSFCLYQKGFTHCCLEQWESARESFHLCQKNNAQYQFNLNAAYPYIGMAVIQLHKNQSADAQASLLAAFECNTKSGNQVELICIVYVLAELFAIKKQYTKSLNYYSKVRKLYQTTGFQPWITLRLCFKHCVPALHEQYTEEEIQMSIDHAGPIDANEVLQELKG